MRRLRHTVSVTGESVSIVSERVIDAPGFRFENAPVAWTMPREDLANLDDEEWEGALAGHREECEKYRRSTTSRHMMDTMERAINVSLALAINNKVDNMEERMENIKLRRIINAMASLGPKSAAKRK